MSSPIIEQVLSRIPACDAPCGVHSGSLNTRSPPPCRSSGSRSPRSAVSGWLPAGTFSAFGRLTAALPRFLAPCGRLDSFRGDPSQARYALTSDQSGPSGLVASCGAASGLAKLPFRGCWLLPMRSQHSPSAGTAPVCAVRCSTLAVPCCSSAYTSHKSARRAPCM